MKSDTSKRSGIVSKMRIFQGKYRSFQIEKKNKKISCLIYSVKGWYYTFLFFKVYLSRKYMSSSDALYNITYIHLYQRLKFQSQKQNQMC